MVRKAKKASKGDDAFKDRKQKVGRKKLAPATATRAEVHARTLRINNAVSFQSDDNKTENDGVVPHRSFSENVQAAHHYRANVRMGALGSLTAQVEEEGVTLSPVHRLQALTAALSALSDTDNAVRDRSVQLATALLKTCEADSQTTSQILQHIHIALTHAVFGVRKSGVTLLQVFLTSWPGVLRNLIGTDMFDPVQIMSRVFEVLSLSQKPSFCVLATLVEELVGSITSAGMLANPCLADGLNRLLESSANILQVHWKELMEMRYSLFRDPVSFERAVAIARLLGCAAIYLRDCSCVSKHFARLLRDMFVARVPFTTDELCADSSHGDLACGIACCCIAILSNNIEAQRTVQVFLTSSLSRASATTTTLQLCVRLMLYVASSAPAVMQRFSSLLPPLMRTLTRAAAAQSCSAKVILDSAELLAIYLGLPDPTSDTVQHLGACFSLVPRTLFSARRFEKSDACRIGRALLSVVWQAASMKHPAFQSIDIAGLADTLQSMFGIVSDNRSVEGFIDVVDDDEVASCGVHLFYYLKLLPKSVHHRIPEEVCVLT